MPKKISIKNNAIPTRAGLFRLLAVHGRVNLVQ
jgi:hypothetical protein